MTFGGPFQPTLCYGYPNAFWLSATLISPTSFYAINNFMVIHFFKTPGFIPARKSLVSLALECTENYEILNILFLRLSQLILSLSL